MAKLEKGQPQDTTGCGNGGSIAPQKKDTYNSDSVGKSGNYHQKPKARQDGVNQKDSVNAGDYLWGLKDSETQGPIKG